ncbi:hypothetical protein R1sor_011640 [Riccia sorocarpa]|uniref:Uncharacterized protein n=1 Tax=Riccia sorocarpa TaxID=122646 RepID=A0ABD3I7L6_9MARC
MFLAEAIRRGELGSEKLGNIELQAGGAGCSDDLGLEEGEFDPRAGEAGNDLGLEEGERGNDFGARDGEWEGGERNDVLGLEEGEYDTRDGEEGLVSRDHDLGFKEGVSDSRDHEGVFDVSDRDRGGEKFGKDELRVNRDERNVQFGLEEGKCVESESEEREGPNRFDIDRVLVEELTPNRGVSFLKEWPSVEKAKPTRDYCSNPTVERIDVENFPIQDCVDILPTDSQSIEGPPSALPMSSGSGSSKATEAKRKADLEQAAKEAEDKAVDSSEGILAKVRHSRPDSSEARVYFLDLLLHFLTCS